MNPNPKWKKGFKQGSTVFKEVVKNGTFQHYVCNICGEIFGATILAAFFESHEIMHLLQQIRANLEDCELVFHEERSE